jgi:hypothetical protein
VDPLKTLREIQFGKGSAIPGEAEMRKNGGAILVAQSFISRARR